MANFVMVAYRDKGMANGILARKALWEDVGKLPKHLRYYAVRVFHQQNPDPSQPPNEVNYNGDDILYISGGSAGLTIGRRNVSGADQVQKETNFEGTSFDQEHNLPVERQLEDVRVSAAPLNLLTADRSLSDHDSKVATALAMDQNDDTLVPWV